MSLSRRLFPLVSATLLFTAIPASAATPTWAKKATVFPIQCNPKAAPIYKNQTPRGALTSSEAPCTSFPIASPDGKSRIQVSYRKAGEGLDYNSAYLLVTTPDGRTRETTLPYGFQDIDLLWSPDSRAFFVNGGDGGGYWGFWVYAYLLKDPKLEPIDIAAEARLDMVKSFPPCKATYLDKKTCKRMESSPQPDDYNVSGIDWTTDSAVVVMAEVPCAGSYGGIMCQVMGYELEVPTGNILKRMTAPDFAAKWQRSMAFKFEVPDPPEYCDQASNLTHPGCAGDAQISPPEQAFSKIVPALVRKTSVPLRLPSDLPHLGESDFQAIINSADETGYIIVLGATPDCEGQHVCSYGALIGTSRPLKDIDFYAVSERKGVMMKLHHGIVGHFYNTVCNAYCSDSLIVWTEGQYHYIIGLKAESKSNVIRAANSAIDAANRWK